jgi:phosphatidylglycerophosphate synthase
MTGLKWLNVPNSLSASRIVFLPVLFLLMFAGHHYLFLITYVLLGSTDFFDGLLARKLGQVSPFGKELDSLADLFFYISSAYFLYYLFPEVIVANQTYLIVFFSLLGLSFLVSGFLFRKPVMMHTSILRLNAVLVCLVVILSFWLDTTYFVRGVLILYIIGFIEELLIFAFFGNVDPDTKSLLHLLKSGKKDQAA